MLDVLIVEDDALSRAPLRTWFERQECRCTESPDLASAREALADKRFDLALVDQALPDGSGLDLLADLKPLPDTDAVMISGNTTVESAIDALRLGARDILPKPIELPRLQAIVQNLARAAALRREVKRLRDELRRLGRFGDMVGESPVMQHVYEAIERVAPTDATVLLTGPTGTGKELAAATIHRLSRRAGKPFVAVNCGAVSPSLIESELFGHERGSFTGADRQRKGVFEQADGGTLLLDEVTEMPLEMQVRLLRVLETFTLTRVGGNSEIKVDVRIVAATNRDPHEAVRAGALRQDLLYRLFVFPIRMPTLKERGDDVLLLARAFLAELDAEGGPSRIFSPAVLARLAAHDWPGNVRELNNVVKRAAIMARSQTIEESDLPLELPVEPPAAAPAGVNGSDELHLCPGMSIAEAERRLIGATLEHVGGDKRRAAEMLGISLKTLYTRLKVYEALRSAG